MHRILASSWVPPDGRGGGNPRTGVWRLDAASGYLQLGCYENSINIFEENIPQNFHSDKMIEHNLDNLRGTELRRKLTTDEKIFRANFFYFATRYVKKSVFSMKKNVLNVQGVPSGIICNMAVLTDTDVWVVQAFDKIVTDFAHQVGKTEKRISLSACWKRKSENSGFDHSRFRSCYIDITHVSLHDKIV